MVDKKELGKVLSCVNHRFDSAKRGATGKVGIRYELRTSNDGSPWFVIEARYLEMCGAPQHVEELYYAMFETRAVADMAFAQICARLVN